MSCSNLRADSKRGVPVHLLAGPAQPSPSFLERSMVVAAIARLSKRLLRELLQWIFIPPLLLFSVNLLFFYKKT